jgi:hypothetical protein
MTALPVSGMITPGPMSNDPAERVAADVAWFHRNAAEPERWADNTGIRKY